MKDRIDSSLVPRTARVWERSLDRSLVAGVFLVLAMSGVKQVNGQCTSGYSVSPSSASFSASAGSGSFNVNIPASCFYFALPGTCFQWLQINSVGGTGTVSFSFSANPTCNSRSCSITITNGSSTGVASFTVNQAGSGSMQQPSPINGPSELCTSTESQYSISSVSGATSYEWTFTGLGTLPGSGTSITFSPPTSGNLSVRGVNSCGNGPTRTLAISLQEVPEAPAAIGTVGLICSDVPNTFTVPEVDGATSYTWIYEGDTVGTGGSTSLDFSPSGAGTMEVFASNSCWTGPSVEAEIEVSTVPETPGSITGSAAICINSELAYTIDPVPDATSYAWLLPSDWTGDSDSTTITVMSTASAGPIQVAAVNSCGTSGLMTLEVELATPSAEPGPITGPAEVCPDTDALYSILSLPNATSIEWVLPADWSGSSDSTSILVASIPSPGTIQVLAFDGCVWSMPDSLVVSFIPALTQPTPIMGPQQPCEGSAVVYSVEEIPGAESYVWTLPNASWSGTSTSSSITVDVGTTGGLMRVRGVDQCGEGEERTRNLTIRTIPEALTSITGPTTVCVNVQATYTTQSSFGVDYLWEMTGASVPSVETLANSVLVTWTQLGSQSISVSAMNICGTGPSIQFPVEVVSCTSVDDISAVTGMRLYPNPAMENTTLEWDRTWDVRSVEIYDGAGRVLMSFGSGSSDSWHMDRRLQVDLQGLEAGTYIVRITAGSKGFSLPLIKAE